VSVACSWDSSIHDSVHLNRITSPNERIYLIAKVTLQLSHPACMELVVRKRIAVNIYNKQVSVQHVPVKTPERVSLSLKKMFFNHRCTPMWPYMHVCSTELHPESEEEDVLEKHSLLLWTDLRDCFQHTKGATAVHERSHLSTAQHSTLSVVHRSTSCSCVFSAQASEEHEERETLALMAARGETEEAHGGESYMEKYTRGVLEVETILGLERLRQVWMENHCLC